MTNHLKGLLMTIFAVVILSPDSVLIRLVEEASSEIDSWTVLFWIGSLYAVGVSLLVLIKYRSKTIAEFKNIGKGGLLIGLACFTKSIAKRIGRFHYVFTHFTLPFKPLKLICFDKEIRCKIKSARETNTDTKKTLNVMFT